MLLGEESPREINPPEPVAFVWLVAGAVLLLLAVVLPALAWWWARRRRARQAATGSSVLEQLREQHLTALDRTLAQWETGEVTAAVAVREASGRARLFVGVALDLDVDFMTLAEVEALTPTEPRVAEVVDLVRRSYPVAFAGAATDDVGELLAGFRGVVARWR